MRYLLGVDGGNTKTDFLLCTEDGTFIDVYRCGSCSHEAVGGFDNAEKAMREHLNTFLSRNKICVDDIAAGGFGLAGADFPWQVDGLTRRIAKLGFRRFTVANDGILGVKAASDSGVGVCVVNGTATVVIGIDRDGTIQQVGGIGETSGDLSGGIYALRKCFRALFDYHFRCGANSSIFPHMMKMLNCTEEDLMEMATRFWEYYDYVVDVLQMADREAQKADPVAMGIFDNMGLEMAHSAAGCAKLLCFGASNAQPLPIVLVGSVWHKITYPGMLAVFEKTLRNLIKMPYRLIPLNAPPAVGGVLWAKEILENKPVDSTYREKILNSLTLEKYESLVTIRVDGIHWHGSLTLEEYETL